MKEPAAGFWLSHHHPSELHRTYSFSKWHVCARCLGTYPTLMLALVWQQCAQAPLAAPWDLWGGVALLLPALLDWAHGQLRPSSGNNPWRTVTGVGLGLALGRSLYIHVHRPFPEVLVWQAGVVLAVALPVMLLRSWRSKG